MNLLAVKAIDVQWLFIKLMLSFDNDLPSLVQLARL